MEVEVLLLLLRTQDMYRKRQTSCFVGDGVESWKSKEWMRLLDESRRN